MNGHNHVSGSDMPGCPACDSAFTGAGRRWPLPLEEPKPPFPDTDTIAAVLARHTLTYRESHYEDDNSFNVVYMVICQECGDLGYDTQIDEDEAKHQARALMRHLTGKDADELA